MQYIFVHGLGQTEKSWDDVTTNLPQAQLHCPSLQGLLKSQDAAYGPLYECFKEYCNGFYGPLNLCGLSLGGVLALNYAMDFPNKVSSLVLIGAQYKMPKTLLRLQNVVFWFMPKSLFEDMGFTKKSFISLANSMAMLDFTDGLPNIHCRALVICGDKDRANRQAAIELSQKLENARLVLIPNANHEVNVDNPEGLAQELKKFYQEAIPPENESMAAGMAPLPQESEGNTG